MADRTLWQALPGLLESLPDSVRADVERLRATPKEASLETCRTLLRTWPFDRALVRPALGPTIPLHCTDEFLVGCRDLASEYGVRIQTHLAESRTQALLGRKKYGGETLTAHLGQLGLVSERLSGAHGVWLERDDMARLSDAGASIAHNPLSNLRLGSGVAPVQRMRQRGLRVGIGTDAVSTSDTQNMFEATRLASYLSRIVSVAPADWLRADEALEMATIGSAAILGMDDSIGQIAPGYRADILFLDLGHVNYVPLNDMVLQIVNGESGAALDKVMIDGRVILEHNRVLTVDESKVRADVERAVERLRDVNAQAAAFARAVEGYVGSFCIAHLCQPHLTDHPILHTPGLRGSCI
jgi:5-methylthioadenosine/S-adenosylhomocysteine deaminase